jgi:hypothetical protein
VGDIHTPMNTFFLITHFLKVRYQNGVRQMAPARQYRPNFHAFSLSRVRAYTLVIKKMMYSDDRV